MNLALELLSPPIDDVEIVVGEPTPLLLGWALELLYVVRAFRTVGLAI